MIVAYFECIGFNPHDAFFGEIKMCEVGSELYLKMLEYPTSWRLICTRKI